MFDDMQILLGSLINAAAIVIGGSVGLLLKKGIHERFEALLMDTLALVIFLIGLMSALKTGDIMLMVVSLVIGGLAGEAMRLEDRLIALGKRLEARIISDKESSQGKIAIGLVHASLVFCIGSMAVIGALESGLSGNHHTLFAKSLLDGVISVFFAAALGPGVILSAVPVLLYEGSLTLGASALSSIMDQSMVIEISAIGGILIMALALNMAKLKTIKVVNLLPSLLIAAVWLIFF